MEIYNDKNIQNLVVVGGIKKHEYYQTVDNGDMMSFFEHSFKRHVSPEVFRKNETNTMKALQNLFYYELPKKINSLIKKESYEELHQVGKLLEKSILGLENFKTVYQGDDIIKYIDEFIDKYARKQLYKIVLILTKKGIVDKKYEDIVSKLI